MSSNQYDLERDEKYLELLSQSFPTIADASTEIINLSAILNLPKGTEHFLADIHGEYEAFQHVLMLRVTSDEKCMSFLVTHFVLMRSENFAL